MSKDIKITSESGFHLKISSYVFSIQIGRFNYCDNKSKINNLSYYALMTDDKANECDNAEVAVFYAETKEWCTHLFFDVEEGEDVVGYVELPKILDAIEAARGK